LKTDFSERLSTLRRSRGLNQRQAARELGISQALLSHYENGVREPRFEFVLRACDYYNVTADHILGRSSSETAGDGGELHRFSDYSLAEAALIASLHERGDERASLAASRCAASYMRRLAVMIEEPAAPADPEAAAATLLCEAELLNTLNAE